MTLMTIMTIMTINAVIAPIPLMTKPHHGRSIILSFTKVAKRFQLCKFSSKKLRIYPSSFLCKRSYVSTAQGVTGGCEDLEKCYS